MLGRATIRLGIGPHSSFHSKLVNFSITRGSNSNWNSSMPVYRVYGECIEITFIWNSNCAFEGRFLFKSALLSL